MKTTLIAILTLIALSGCSMKELYKTHTSGVTGCTTNSIKITNDEYGFWTHTQNWEAECNGKNYICSRMDNSIASCIKKQ